MSLTDSQRDLHCPGRRRHRSRSFAFNSQGSVTPDVVGETILMRGNEIDA